MATTEGFRADWAQKDFYAELGVKKDATNADIKKAYRKLARANHPDSNPGDDAKHDKFKTVAEAYDVVGDPEKRKKYDEMRELYGSGGLAESRRFRRRRRLQPRRPAAGPRRRRGGGAGGGIGDMFGDLFGGFGRGRTQTQARPQKGADAETTATIGFTDAIDGVTISLRLTSDAPCPDCSGTGGKPGTRPHICPECEGAGFIVNTVGGGAFSLNETCPKCGGRQLIYDEPCPTCHGSGHGLSARSIQARIPAGVKDGQRIRLKGKGSAGVNGGPAGDLYVTVQVSKHRLFGRKGDNLTLDVPISFDEAALGAEIKIPTMGGSPVTVKVPAGTPNGRTFRIRGKGSRRKDGTMGDLLATVQVQVPGTLNAEARAAVDAYRAAGNEQSLRANLFSEARAMSDRQPFFGAPSPDAAVFVISVAAELTGLHPQTLRTYERMGLIRPGRTGGGGRRYSARDIDLLREISDLTSSGIGIEGVRRILELENRLAALSARNEELLAELEATREALRQAVSGRPQQSSSTRLPAVRQQQSNQSIVVWRRGR